VRPNLAGTSELWFAVGDKICRGAMIRDTAKKDAAEVNSKLAPEADSPVSAPSRETEYAMIQRIVHGEKELFYQLVRPYERRVYVMAFAILRNEADAQDAAQDALFKAFKHLAQFRSEARFSTWLIQVTLNEARMRLRKNHLEIMRPIDEVEQEDGSYTPRDFTDWREIPSEALERKQVREMLVKALASLTEKYREVFVLRDVQHMSTEEAAEVLGISAGAVKTRLLRARLMLRDFLAPGLDGAWATQSNSPKGIKPWS
jgi:RNA polymerase sigma-70 factor (ECF subfamily)